MPLFTSSVAVCLRLLRILRPGSCVPQTCWKLLLHPRDRFGEDLNSKRIEFLCAGSESRGYCNELNGIGFVSVQGAMIYHCCVQTLLLVMCG